MSTRPLALLTIWYQPEPRSIRCHSWCWRSLLARFGGWSRYA
ncbi:hypothetical protein [Streptomyces sp. NPDC054854]